MGFQVSSGQKYRIDWTKLSLTCVCSYNPRSAMPIPRFWLSFAKTRIISKWDWLRSKHPWIVQSLPCGAALFRQPLKHGPKKTKKRLLLSAGKSVLEILQGDWWHSRFFMSNPNTCKWINSTSRFRGEKWKIKALTILVKTLRCCFKLRWTKSAGGDPFSATINARCLNGSCMPFLSKISANSVLRKDPRPAHLLVDCFT